MRVARCQHAPGGVHEWALIAYVRSPGPPHPNTMHVFCRRCLTEAWHDQGAQVEYLDA